MIIIACTAATAATTTAAAAGEEVEEEKTRSNGTLGTAFALKGANELQAVSFAGSTVSACFRLLSTPHRYPQINKLLIKNRELVQLKSNIKTLMVEP